MSRHRSRRRGSAGQDPVPEPRPEPVSVSSPATATPRRAARAIRIEALLLGLPAPLVAFGLLGMMAWARHALPARAYYQARVEQHTRTHDDASLLVCLKRLLVLGPNQPEMLFDLARTYERLGMPEQGESVARAIAPPGQPGFQRAHEWLALRRMGQADRLEAAREAESHLMQLVRSHPEQPVSQVMLGILYARTGHDREARPILEYYAGDDPMLLLTLATTCSRLGDHKAYAKYLARARKAAARVTEESPSIPELRLTWANICTLQGDYETAFEVLRKGDATQFPAFRRQEALTYAAWIDARERLRTYLESSLYAELEWADPDEIAWTELARVEAAARPSALLALIEKGLVADPRCEPLLIDLTRFLTLASPRVVSETRQAVLQMRSRPELAAATGYVLGAAAEAYGRPLDARNYWDTAYVVDPDLPLLANNLAYNLATTSPADAAHGLAIIDRLLRQVDDPRFRVTRGQVLGKLGRWQESADELESALAAGYRGQDAHDSLALAYDHLGQRSLAAEHRKGH